MVIRKLVAAAVLSTGFAAVDAAPAFAADPAAKQPMFGFSTLRAATPEAAKAKVEAWLKSVDKFDKAAFDKVWADEGRTVLDRTADSLALGNTEAAVILANVRKPDAPAPTEIPGLLKDASQDAFFRTNVVVAFAKAAASKKVYEEALEALNSVTTPEAAVDPAAFYFFKAVSEHATMRKEPATGSIVKLLDDVADAPDRYKMVATLMFFEMQNWSPDPKALSNIERLMDNSGRRLELARAGEKTQDIQKKIVFRLDELIKELENKNKPGDGPPNGGNCPGGGPPGGPPGSSPGNQNNPTQNAADSMIMGGSGKGTVDEKQLRQIAEQWGGLPPEKRAKIVEDITRDQPQKYKQMIDEYFKSLNKIHGYK
ncbi:Hypothetical conserved protein OS=uncultured planctomycete GN=HGMM_F01A04C09 PE=4 SV=1 [Gemmataceae bacterium]|nr:Hypothetical conserved protein OS=uncultured planctomycete GN=HGMM_F01A04C09 PE=4 SV=1 [Gemmataceae bacterium]VTT96605.1 Hypothetical conserved protein OS=uncultured planctomycete GN=HGMM_F01A04C09 PE=4 SV=1 [Gemmataceae bacterium]